MHSSECCSIFLLYTICFKQLRLLRLLDKQKRMCSSVPRASSPDHCRQLFSLGISSRDAAKLRGLVWLQKKEHTARPRQYLSGQMDKQEIGLSDVFSTKVNSANVSPIPKLCPFLTLFHICIFVLFACAPRHLSKQVMKENGLRMSD